ncbi:hypothetical protein [Variovorax sp. GT1P44]|uniref:hypothetical protein n=1 Tax=Variovorax sp. GT1P44 TaxID=3443742 RepID=UPI003F4758EA
MDVQSIGATVSGAAPLAGLIDLADRAPWQALDKSSFSFRHGLAHDPLFELSRLGALSEKVFDRANYARYFQPDELKLGIPELRRRLRNAIETVGSTHRWLAIHYVNEMDTAFEELYQDLLAHVEELAGFPIRKCMTWGSMSVFMNSPGLVAPYHFDHETNFLLQIRGEKYVTLYPSRLAVTASEVEDFYRHNPIAGHYRDEIEDIGTTYQLLPGIGVHHPPLDPHLVKNGKEVSVSLSFYYTLPETDYRARVHQVNFFLRKLGVQPRPPGESHLIDDTKNRVIRALSKSNPRTHDEALYSGVKRLTAPARFAKSVLRRVSG